MTKAGKNYFALFNEMWMDTYLLRVECYLKFYLDPPAKLVPQVIDCFCPHSEVSFVKWYPAFLEIWLLDY